MNSDMFTNDIRLLGRHAFIMQKLCNNDRGSNEEKKERYKFKVTDSSEGIYIFDRRIDCYMVAAMLGIINNRTAEEDTNPPYKEDNVTMLAQVVKNEKTNLEQIYDHMVLSENNDLSTDEKIQKAFSEDEDPDNLKVEFEHFNSYVRGGLEILDEYFSSCDSYESVCGKIIDLVQDYL